MCMSSPKPPPPPPPPAPPPEAPKPADPATKAARTAEKRTAAQMAGRKGTILTGSRGVLAEADTSRKTLLGA
jgi:hypothetical protein